MSALFASFSTFLSFLVGLLFIFFCVGNFSVHERVARHIRIVDITTDGFGAALFGPSGPPVYGNPHVPRGVRMYGDGLRIRYTWGLWNRCAGYHGPSDLQYCTRTRWAHRFYPSAALLEDVPFEVRNRAAALLSNEYGRLKSDYYLGVWSRVAFYFIFVSLCLVAIIIVASLLSARGPGRLAYLNLSAISFLAFVSSAIGSLIWTSIIATFRNQLRNEYSHLGLSAHYGNAIWMLWAIVVALFFSIFVNLSGCLVGRRSA